MRERYFILFFIYGFVAFLYGNVLEESVNFNGNKNNISQAGQSLEWQLHLHRGLAEILMQPGYESNLLILTNLTQPPSYDFSQYEDLITLTNCSVSWGFTLYISVEGPYINKVCLGLAQNSSICTTVYTPALRVTHVGDTVSRAISLVGALHFSSAIWNTLKVMLMLKSYMSSPSCYIYLMSVQVTCTIHLTIRSQTPPPTFTLVPISSLPPLSSPPPVITLLPTPSSTETNGPSPSPTITDLVDPTPPSTTETDPPKPTYTHDITSSSLPPQQTIIVDNETTTIPVAPLSNGPELSPLMQFVVALVLVCCSSSFFTLFLGLLLFQFHSRQFRKMDEEYNDTLGDIYDSGLLQILGQQSLLPLIHYLPEDKGVTVWKKMRVMIEEIMGCKLVNEADVYKALNIQYHCSHSSIQQICALYKEYRKTQILYFIVIPCNDLMPLSVFLKNFEKQHFMLLLRIISGLRYLMQNHISHRNLDYQAIYVSPYFLRNYELKICCFEKCLQMTRLDDTVKEEILINSQIVPEEVLENHVYTMKTDLYGFACLAISLIENRPHINVPDLRGKVLKSPFCNWLRTIVFESSWPVEQLLYTLSLIERNLEIQTLSCLAYPNCVEYEETRKQETIDNTLPQITLTVIEHYAKKNNLLYTIIHNPPPLIQLPEK